MKVRIVIHAPVDDFPGTTGGVFNRQYTKVYRETALDAPEMPHVKSVLQFILERHEPYGAVVLDRHFGTS